MADVGSPELDRRDGPLAELSRVMVVDDLAVEEGRLPAGSTGTIVYAYLDGLAYEVEFVRPFHCLVTLESRAISGPVT